MNKVMFSLSKGGVGKTTLSLNTGYVLATQLNRKVLLVDLDPQGSLTKTFQEKGKEHEYTVFDVLKDIKFNINQAIYKTPYKNLDYIPASFNLEKLDIAMTGKFISPVERLSTQLMKIEKEYDYCICDGATAQSTAVLNGLLACDLIIAPIQGDSYAQNAVLQYKSVIDGCVNELGMKKDYFLLPNKKDYTKNFHSSIEQFKKDGLNVFETAIRNTVKVSESTKNKMPIVLYDKTATTSQDIVAFTSELEKHFNKGVEK